jgi:LacI family transcriptional regulator
MAGVSRGTVDRALNDRPGIRPEVKAHVLKIAENLGYRSNRAGKLLGLHKTPICIGIQMPSEGNDFFDAVISGQNQALVELQDFGVSLQRQTMKGFSAQLQARQIDELIASGIQALAIVPIDHKIIHDRLNRLAQKNFPVITFNTDLECVKRLCYVGNDYLRSGATAAGLLGRIADNRQYRVVILTGSVQMLGHNQRIHGFNRVIKSRYPLIEVADIYETEDDDKKAYEITCNVLKKYPDINAIYCTAGGVSGCCRALMDADLGGRIKVISFDRTPSMEKYLRNSVITASIEQEPFMQGYLPIKFLFEYLLDGTSVPDRHLTKNEIVISENM